MSLLQKLRIATFPTESQSNETDSSRPPNLNDLRHPESSSTNTIIKFPERSNEEKQVIPLRKAAGAESLTTDPLSTKPGAGTLRNSWGRVGGAEGSSIGGSGSESRSFANAQSIIAHRDAHDLQETLTYVHDREIALANFRKGLQAMGLYPQSDVFANLCSRAASALDRLIGQYPQALEDGVMILFNRQAENTTGLGIEVYKQRVAK